MDDKKPSVGVIEEFKTEFGRCWLELPNKGLFFGLLAAWFILFQFLGNGTFGYVDTSSLIYWMYNAYNNDDVGSDDSQGNLIPIAVMILFWWKRKELLSLRLGVWWPALFMLAGALLLHVAGYLIQQPRISIIAFFAGIYSLMGLAWGRHWLVRSIFPCGLFIFSMPFGSLSEPISFPLRIIATKIVAGITPLLGIDVVRNGTQLFNSARTYQFEVAAACSGIRSLTAIIALTTIVAFVFISSNPKRFIIIASAIPLAVIGNVIRLLSIVLAADLFGQETGNWVHENVVFGLLPYVPVFIGLFFLVNKLNKGREPQALPLEPKPV